MRGEDVTRAMFSTWHSETPPRAWGRPSPLPRSPRVSRNTPTCVGKTQVVQEGNGAGRKHPHVRGEDRKPIMGNSGLTETPPRAWGRLPVDDAMRKPTRNTPTCVGKTPQGRQTRCQPEKHPHVRGEDAPLKRQMCDKLETPPRAWGRLNRGELTKNPTGNTPTCVGKTQFSATAQNPL